MRVDRVKSRQVLAAVIATLLVGGCTTVATSPVPSETVALGDPLPTLADWPLPSNWACGGVGMMPLILQGSPDEGVFALWQGTKHVPIEWPPGYSVSYLPTLTVRDPLGAVVATTGTDLVPGRLPGLLVCTMPAVIDMLPVGS